MLVDIVAKDIVTLLAEMKREIAANPDQKEGRGPNQKSVPVHREEVGVKGDFAGRNYNTDLTMPRAVELLQRWRRS